MRRRFIAAVIGSALAASMFAGCGSGGGSTTSTPAVTGGSPTASATAPASPTVAPTQPVSPTAEAPTEAPEGQPTSAPAPTQPPAVQPTKAPPPPPPPTQPPATQSRTVVAQNVAFDPKQLSVAANVPLTVTLDNRDTGVQHDIIIYAPDGAQVAETAVITGPATASATFTPGAGTYRFKCSVHPQQMFGAISVQ